ncbi:MAG: endonuclease III [Verrucomicrobiales bacterium]|jgi:endonuclease-3|nr:endonuclease III [Verrucomicrobiales bacterium]
MNRQQRTLEQIRVLKSVYPDARCELHFANPLQLLVATILSAQCTDARVNMVTPALFAKYRTAQEFADSDPVELENLIRSAGFFHTKARHIRECCRLLVADHDGRVPRAMEELRALPGVGRKTANVVLGNAFGLNAGVVVDTHVARLSARLGMTRQTDPVKIEVDLMKLTPRDDWALLSHLLIWHGRRRCKARRPDCANCELRKICPRKLTPQTHLS